LPTLEDVLRAQLGTFIFLDIKEPIHEAVYQLVQKYNAQDRVLVSLNRQFADQLLQSSFARTVAVMPKLDQYENETCAPNADPVTSVAGYASLKTYIYEAVFCDDDYLARASSATRGSKLWVNTLGPRFVAGRTEEVALRAPDKIWGELLNRGVGAIQTDHPLELLVYLKKSGRR
jgi:glycerophosphoryl diester phosphodiesterase